MSFQIIREDITKVSADAIVNSANPQATYGNGTDRAIYKAAGEKELLEARKKIGNIVRGEIAVTPAFKLKAKYIIHTVGPWWEDGEHGELETLHKCYKKSLEKAKELGCKSIAFPLIATGTYGFPKADALRIALDEINAFIIHEEMDMDITLVVFDEKAFEVSKKIKSEVLAYIDNYYIAKKVNEEYKSHEELSSEEAHCTDIEKAYQRRDIHDPGDLVSYKENNTLSKEIKRKKRVDSVLKIKDNEFKDKLNKLMLEKSLDPPDVYKAADVDRKVFSKILGPTDYHPSKPTVIKIAFALELSLDQTLDLLESCGYALSTGNQAELVIRACIETGCNRMETEEMLFDLTLPGIEKIK